MNNTIINNTINSNYKLNNKYPPLFFMEYSLFISPIFYYYYIYYLKRKNAKQYIKRYNTTNTIIDPFQKYFETKYYYDVDKLIIGFNLYYRLFHINDKAITYSIGLLYCQKIILSQLFSHRHTLTYPTDYNDYNTFFDLHTGNGILICIFSNNKILYFILSLYMTIIYLEKKCKLFDIFIGINAGVLSYYVGTGLYNYRIHESHIDFCEKNFYVTKHIPEFLNTISSLLWMGFATKKFYNVIFVIEYNNIKKYMKLLNIFIAGASAMLHGSLLRIWQISDEFLIICFLNTCQLFMINKIHYIAFTYTFLYFGYFYFTFNYFVAILIFIALHNVYIFYSNKGFIPKKPFFYSLLSLCIWFLDWYICNNYIPLHALWHITIGISVDKWIDVL